MCEIKVLFRVPTGCNSPKIVRPEIDPCTLLICIVMIHFSKNMHTPCAHLQKSCTRPQKCVRRAQGSPLFSDTAHIPVILIKNAHKCKNISQLYISIAYYMQKWGGWVQIACKIAYVLNGRSLISRGNTHKVLLILLQKWLVALTCFI